ncbi:MAG TPA: PaaI family thioesterase [Candidatus Eisenbacteria bacterium]|nr:PaaI family thioesterase [Candidatus Eisenbacteria bacterium]
MTDQAATALIRQAMPFCATLGVRADKYTAQEVELSLDWAPEVCTTNGILHGGVIMALADSAGGACALLNLPKDASGTSTIESKTNFVGAVRSGTVTAIATPLLVGRTTIVVETSVRDASGRLVAKVTQSQIVLRPRS